jgi:sulfur relay (sulfurtransferase) complex TusBCD TusD component (DsrE family)
MKIGIIVGANDSEVVWIAFRFEIVAFKENHTAKVFLINKGVEAECIKDEKLNVAEQLHSLVGGKGEILACGTCLKARQKEVSEVCPIPTMKDLPKLVEESDKLLAFG